MKKISVALLILMAALVACDGGSEGGTTTTSYTVVFDSQGGSAITNQSVNNGDNAVEPATPVKTGYIFGGWYTDLSYSDIWDFNNDTVTENTTLYAQWNTYSYTVTFNGQGANTEASPATKTVASPATMVDALPSAPEKIGYNFAGWYTDTNGNGTEFTATTTVTTDITVYAYWTENPAYTVTYNSQSATTPANPATQTVLSPTYTVGTLPADPARSGYIFSGWFTDTNGNGTEFLADTVVTGNITVYAYWTTYSYRVNFDSQSATTDADPAYILVESPDTTVGILPAEPDKVGYAFGGWWTEEDGLGMQFSAGTAVTEDMTVYAYWSDNSITFNANGGTGSMLPQTIEYNDTRALTANTYTRAGYTFAGWSSDSAGSVEYADGANYTMEMDTDYVTLYAVWTANNYTVSFAPNGGTGTMADQTITCDDTAALTAITFTRDSYTFDGWATTSTGDVEYEDGADYTMGTESVTLYARWTANNYTVSFAPNGGTGTMADQTIACDNTVALTANAFTMDGYVFDGWATTSTGDVEYEDGADYTMGMASVTLYAKWTANNYTVSFAPNGGTGTMADQIIAYNDTAALTANAFTRDGYTFDGWALPLQVM